LSSSLYIVGQTKEMPSLEHYVVVDHRPDFVAVVVRVDVAGGGAEQFSTQQRKKFHMFAPKSIR
jgi:hypothetical protein